MKSLIIYFSRAGENYVVGYIEKGNTEIIAEYLQELTGADMFRVEPLVPYSDDYAVCLDQAKLRIGNALIKGTPASIEEYDTIYVCSPCYWGTYAPEMETALKALDFTGKYVRAVCTHEGSGLADMPKDLEQICQGAIFDKKGLAIRGSRAKHAKKDVEKWLKKEK